MVYRKAKLLGLPQLDFGLLVSGLGKAFAGSLLGYVAYSTPNRMLRMVASIPGIYLTLSGLNDIIKATHPLEEKYPEVPEEELDTYRKAFRVKLEVPKWFDVWKGVWDDRNMTIFCGNPNVIFETWLAQELEPVRCYTHLAVWKVKPNKPNPGFKITSEAAIDVNVANYPLRVAGTKVKIGFDEMKALIKTANKSSFGIAGYYLLLITWSSKKLSIDDWITLLKYWDLEHWNRYKVIGAVMTGFKETAWFY